MSTALIPTLPPLPDEFAPIVNIILAGCRAKTTKTRYARKLRVILAYWDMQGRPPFNREFVQKYIAQMQEENFAAFQQAHSLQAVKKLAEESFFRGLLSQETLTGIMALKTPAVKGFRQGHRLTSEEVSKLLALPRTSTLIGLRDRVILDLLFYAGLRRTEVCEIRFEHLQRIDGRPVLMNLRGKGDVVRSVAIPEEVLSHIQEWIDRSGIRDGFICRRVWREGAGHAVKRDDKMDGSGIFKVVRLYSRMLGRPEITPHALRRSCGAIARANGVELDQIQQHYGHSSPHTTILYTGGNQKFAQGSAVCDSLPVAAV